MSRAVQRSRVIVVAAGALAVGTVAGVLSSNDAPLAPPPSQPTSIDGGAPDLGTAPAGSGARVTSSGARWSGALDTTSKAAVAGAYRSLYRPSFSLGNGWTGSASSCTAGTMSSTAQASQLKALNFVRSLAGLQPVTFASTLSQRAQQAALVMGANGSLSHTPPSDWKCWNKTAYDTAGKSNLAMWMPSLGAGQTIKLYMDDPGTYNTAVGHRRWLLNPFTTQMGTGATDTANAMVVIGPTGSSRANPRWVQWPSAGYFPKPMDPGGRWSLSSGLSGTDFSAARVRVRRVGHGAMRVRRFATHDGYAMPALVFQVKGKRPAGAYVVRVRNIKGAGPGRMSYKVRLFAP